MDVLMDEKWKLSKRGSRNSSSRREVQAVTCSSTSTSNSMGSGPCYLRRSSSMPEGIKSGRIRACTGPEARSSSSPRSSFTRRCADLVKEQRAKFYIMRRCVTMLICWRDYP